MSSDRQTFLAPKSAATMARIIDFIRASKTVETGPIIALAKLAPKRVREYLRHAEELELIHRIPRKKRVGRLGTNALRWRIGRAPKRRTKPVDAAAKAPVAQPVQHHELHAAFFGAQQKG